MGYQPIDDYAVIGDLHTVALVGKNGSIDWWCAPRFDSPSVFAAILDQANGGRWSISPEPDEVTYKQLYFPDTNVLITRFLSADGVVELTDFMPAGDDEESHGQPIIRRVEAVRGSMSLRMRCEPAFDYARVSHTIRAVPRGVCFESPVQTLTLASSVPMRTRSGVAHAQFTLTQGERVTFVLSAPGEDRPILPSEKDIERLFRRTVDYWHRWLSRCTYRGRWREMVNRSALALKLLTYKPTGAILAAPTTSLPETLGGERNWDYRYTWIRDASFTLYALMHIGFTEEAHAFMDWLRARLREAGPDGSLQVMYSLDGGHDLTEQTLDHLEGYRQSRPVRIGNAAHRQLQLDLYGEMLDAVYLFDKYGAPIGYDDWVEIRRVLNHLCDIWQQPDAGIWEFRQKPRHFVHSKMMCWVALDRGLRLANLRSLPADRQRWLSARDTIYEEIMTRGWNREIGSFVQVYDGTTLDASLLLMPLVRFISPHDPRLLSTIAAIRKRLSSGSLVHRYDVEKTSDGLEGDEGTFSMCSFWLVETLTRAGHVEDARLIFERMLGYANHVGLYSEEVGSSGEALGNFPQGFTHLALITAAVILDRALGSSGEKGQATSG
jgi:GH15 family glucan-1,4-alpha-glucosidase